MVGWLAWVFVVGVVVICGLGLIISEFGVVVWLGFVLFCFVCCLRVLGFLLFVCLVLFGLDCCLSFVVLLGLCAACVVLVLLVVAVF